MNERIRELIKQARVQDRGYFIYQYDDHQSVEKAIDFEKFAELIVRECAEVGERYADGNYEVPRQILARFGMDEE